MKTPGPRVLSFSPGSPVPLQRGQQPAAGRKGRTRTGKGEPPRGLGAGSEKLPHGRALRPLRSFPPSQSAPPGPPF